MMKRRRGRQRDFQGMESRRMRAAKMFAAGTKQAEVARRLGVSRQSVSRWYHTWKQQGKPGLKAAGRAGRPPKLTSEQKEEVGRELQKGPQAHGFETNLWTLKRLALVIRRVTGVRFHRAHVSKLMRQLGWSIQRPAKRAKERNEEAVQQWKAVRWPAIKKKRAGRRRGLSSRTKAG